MHVFMKGAALAGAIGLALTALQASAVQQTYYSDGNAPRQCQAFTPGVTNTIRNRATGSENVGALMNVACATDTVASFNGSHTTTVTIGLHNNSADPMSITCSYIGGYFGATAGSVITKTAADIPAGTGTTVDFSADDTADPADTDLGSFFGGTTCGLPTKGVITATGSSWTDEDGT